jgi:hypothetical protein
MSRHDLGISEKPFGFGIVAGHAPDLESWTALAKRTEERGYDTFLATQHDPLTKVSAALAVTSTLHWASDVPTPRADSRARRRIRHHRAQVGTRGRRKPKRSPLWTIPVRVRREDRRDRTRRESRCHRRRVLALAQTLRRADVPELVAGGAVSVLLGRVDQMADTLRRWRERLGICYITINSAFLERFASRVERLRGYLSGRRVMPVRPFSSSVMAHTLQCPIRRFGAEMTAQKTHTVARAAAGREVELLLATGPFAAALRAAIRARGLGLDRIRYRLRSRGVSISLATLSHWQSGRCRPERSESLLALAHIEEVLEVPPGSLIHLLGPPRSRTRGSCAAHPPEDGKVLPPD